MAQKRRASFDIGKGGRGRSPQSKRPASQKTNLRGQDAIQATKPDVVVSLGVPIEIARINQIFDDRVAYLRETTSSPIEVKVLDVFHDVAAFRNVAEQLLSRTVDGQLIIGKDKLIIYKALCQKYSTLWRTTAISAISQRSDDLMQKTDSHPLGRIELEFADLADEV